MLGMQLHIKVPRILALRDLTSYLALWRTGESIPPYRGGAYLLCHNAEVVHERMDGREGPDALPASEDGQEEAAEARQGKQQHDCSTLAHLYCRSLLLHDCSSLRGVVPSLVMAQ